MDPRVDPRGPPPCVLCSEFRASVSRSISLLVASGVTWGECAPNMLFEHQESCAMHRDAHAGHIWSVDGQTVDGQTKGTVKMSLIIACLANVSPIYIVRSECRSDSHAAQVGVNFRLK